MTLETIISGIYDDINDPTSVTSGYISGWLVNNVGRLNNNILTSYTGVSGDITPELGQEESDIYKQLFFINYYSRQIISSLGAGGVDPVVEVTDDGSSIRVLNKNELAKTYIQLKKQSQETLDLLIAVYKQTQSPPTQIIEYDAQKTVYAPTPYAELYDS
jgi:hypothetical protein